MITETSTKEELLTAIANAANQLLHVSQAIEESSLILSHTKEAGQQDNC